MTGYVNPITRQPELLNTEAMQTLVSGDVIVNSRDGMGRVVSYTLGGTTYTVTYGPFGVATESGGGQILTYNYSAAGLLNSTTLS
jgi:hypothetical protein